MALPKDPPERPEQIWRRLAVFHWVRIAAVLGCPFRFFEGFNGKQVRVTTQWPACGASSGWRRRAIEWSPYSCAAPATVSDCRGVPRCHCGRRRPSSGGRNSHGKAARPSRKPGYRPDERERSFRAGRVSGTERRLPLVPPPGNSLSSTRIRRACKSGRSR